MTPVPNVVEAAPIFGKFVLFVDRSGRVEAVYGAPRPTPPRPRVHGGAKVKRLALFGVGQQDVGTFLGDRPREGASVTRVGFHDHVPRNLLVEVNRYQIVTCLLHLSLYFLLLQLIVV